MISFPRLANLRQNYRSRGVASGCGVGGGDAGDDDDHVHDDGHVPGKSAACVLSPCSQYNCPGLRLPRPQGGRGLSCVPQNNLPLPRLTNWRAHARRPLGPRLSRTGAAFHSVSGEVPCRRKRIQQVGEDWAMGCYVAADRWGGHLVMGERG